MAKSTINKYLIQKRKSYQLGGGLSWKKPGMGNAMGLAGSLGSSVVDTIDPQDEYGTQTDLGATASGAMKGASSLAMLGPIGMGVGALAGGAMGLIGNNKAQEAKDTALQRKKSLDWSKALNDSQNILSSYDNAGTGIKSLQTGGILQSTPGLFIGNPSEVKRTKYSFKTGGTIPAERGNLKPIGESESFEVKGNDPNATDDVGLGDAAVDHDEVIKPAEEGMRIFSDSLIDPVTGKKFSEDAKDLEKQKTKDEGRFPEQNEKIEKELDALFQRQQAMNGNNQGESVEEAMQPAGETPGQGFKEGNMFETGGRLAPIKVGDHQMKGISFQPMGKYYRSYHPITPGSFGKFSPIGWGSKVMAGSNVDISNQNINKMITGNLANPRGFHKGGTIAEKLFEVPGFANELKTEPGHGSGSGTFQVGGWQKPPVKTIPQSFIDNLIYRDKPNSKDVTYTMEAYKAAKAAREGNQILAKGVNPIYDNWDNTAYARRYFNKYPTATTAVLGPHFTQGQWFQDQLVQGTRQAQVPVADFHDLAGNVVPHEKMGITISSKFQLGGVEKANRDFAMAGRRQIAGTTTDINSIPGVNPQVSAFDPNKYNITPAQTTRINSTGNLSQLVKTPQIGEFKNTAIKIPGIPPDLNFNKSTKPDWMGALGSAATLAPVFGNMAAARKLPPVADVYLNKPLNLKKVDYSDQANALKQGLRTASLAAGQNSVNPNAQQAGMGNAQAQYMSAMNQMYGDVNRQNTGIANQQAMINTQIQGQNNMLMTQRSQAEQARASNMLGIQSGNRADLSNKTLGLTAQENQKALDKQKYAMFQAWLNKQGSGLSDRNPWMSQFKKGGKMSNRKLVRSC